MKHFYLILLAFCFCVAGKAQTTFTVINNNPTQWAALALYNWGDNSGESLGAWPGVVLYDGTTVNPDNNANVTVVKSGNTFTITLSAALQFENLIINNNNNGSQMDLTGVESGASFTIPAPPTEFYTCYVDDQTGWGGNNLKLYAWSSGQPELFGNWNSTLSFEPETEVIDGVTYKKFPFAKNDNVYHLIFSNNGADNGRVLYDIAAANKDYYLKVTASECTEVTVVTGITTVSSDSNADAPIYDITGRRVNHNYRGIAIQNGKKVIIK